MQKPQAYVVEVDQQGRVSSWEGASSMRDVVAKESKHGAYTVGHTYHTTKVLMWESHLQRLEEPARKHGCLVSLDGEILRKTLRDLVLQSGWPETRFRLFLDDERPEVVRVAIEPFVDEWHKAAQEGVRCVTLSGLSRDEPELKQSSWTTAKTKALQSLPQGIHTGLLVDPANRLLEGLDSNFSAIVGGELRTTTEGVLVGLSLRILLEIAPSIVPVRLSPVALSELESLEEACISSSSRGILPVIEIDGVPVGDGKPGPWVRKLQAAYQEWIDAHLQEL